ncbi:hypothetical protein [Bifidobacterium tissieri]|uniref:hypothetical protein n=1 Tax=Bifidobacterium tissieri TaxID=1630162 RepID=UPI0012385561|nr:hypothetical protein [Bifidobacterium tissieri]KAA8832746.1 hypothetical protein EM849_02410 [Bifidobacterium tissieri]
MDATIQGDTIITTETNPDGSVSQHVTTIDALAAWGVLLGTSSDEETLQLMLQAQDPGVIDQSTGETAWAGVYKAVSQNLSQPAVMSVNDDTPNTALTVAQDRTRSLLGLPPIGQTPMTLSSTGSEEPSPLAGITDRIRLARQRFMASLTHQPREEVTTRAD